MGLEPRRGVNEEHMFDNTNHSTVSDCWRKCEQWVKKKVPEPCKEQKPVTDAADLWLLQAGERRRSWGWNSSRGMQSKEIRRQRTQRPAIHFLQWHREWHFSHCNKRKEKCEQPHNCRCGRKMRDSPPCDARVFRRESRRAAAGESVPTGSTYPAKERIFMNSQLMILMET